MDRPASPLSTFPLPSMQDEYQPRAESARGLAQSRTLARWRGRLKVAKRLGVRQSPAAFPQRRVEKSVSGWDTQGWGYFSVQRSAFLNVGLDLSGTMDCAGAA